MAAVPKERFTLEEYIEFDKNSEERWEYFDSFREYLLVAQDRPYITHYVRQADGSWLRTDIEGLDNEIELVTISCKMPLREIYALVDLSTAAL
jgi:hypothetical protein